MFKDLKGKRFGRLIVIKRLKDSGGKWKWSCDCDCGTKSKLITSGHLNAGTESCGCLVKTSSARFVAAKARIKDISGKVFGRLTVLSLTRTENKRSYYLCKCECGVEKEIRQDSLKSGRTTSCGCVQREAVTIHGHYSNDKASPTTMSWKSMLARCTDPNHANYAHYSSKGITVCDRWFDFNNFLADMGERPEGSQIDRMDNSLGYSKDNCRWVTPKINSNNKDNCVYLTIKDKTQTVTQWSEELGLSRDVVYQRLAKGWTSEEALELTARNRTYMEDVPQ